MKKLILTAMILLATSLVHAAPFVTSLQVGGSTANDLFKMLEDNFNSKNIGSARPKAIKEEASTEDKGTGKFNVVTYKIVFDKNSNVIECSSPISEFTKDIKHPGPFTYCKINSWATVYNGKLVLVQAAASTIFQAAFDGDFTNLKATAQSPVAIQKGSITYSCLDNVKPVNGSSGQCTKAIIYLD